MRAWLIGGLIALVVGASAQAGSPFMNEGNEVSPPSQWPTFCATARAKQEGDCANRNNPGFKIVMDKRTWDTMVAVHRKVTGRWVRGGWTGGLIKPLTDMEHWRGKIPATATVTRDKRGKVVDVDDWRYSDDSYGDCEEYVILWRRLLIDAGFPESSVLFTVVKDKDGAGHLVLTVATNTGDWVLDVMRPEILLWSDTGYKPVKRQWSRNPSLWVEISDSPPVAMSGELPGTGNMFVARPK